MTVIVQDLETENIIVLCKGADMAILERLSEQIE
jgi:magnesium-transporting ATPase (P-type)